ncbi:MAG: PrsW family intramembrane metalloprotease [Ignavibacteriaceae bacterium]|nr:PrsW family intramembrane metalloprotease [Ignavibacteriaceae bacterium]
MLIIASALAAILPMSFYLFLIWRFDKYDREPFKLVLANYLLGALGAIIFAIIGGFLFSSFASLFLKDGVNTGQFGAIVIAPVVEEITKGFFLLITVASRKFDNITDGIVYGGAIGLGFGMTENFLYFILYGTTIQDWIAIVIVRTLFSAAMHCVSTATFGAFLGYAKFKSKFFKVTFPVIGLLLAMTIHSAWNFSVSFQSTAPLGFIFLFITILIFILVFALSIQNEKKTILKELWDETSSGIIPLNHLNILASSSRDKQGWIDERIRKIYIKATTTLAFRKLQSRNSHGVSKLYYENDVTNYRNFIRDLLKQEAA